MLYLLLAATLGCPATLQVKEFGKRGAPAADPFQKSVDAAIDKGLAFLVKKHPRHQIQNHKQAELILLALIHGGADLRHPLIAQGFTQMTGRGLSEVYNVGLRGLLYEKVNRRAYQRQLFDIGMFMAQNQCKNGQWDYGGLFRKVVRVPYAPVITKRTKRARGATVTADEGPPPGKDIKLPKPARKTDKATGDNSNTQYAAMGLLAAARAGIVIPKETWTALVKYLEGSQNGDGGWGYNQNKKRDGSTGSMSTAGIASLLIAKHYLGKKALDEASVKKGLKWLENNFAVDQNPYGPPEWHYYYLYGIEKVGTLSGLTKFGKHEWYKIGAEYLIKNQRADGSWVSNSPSDRSGEVIDTCFAILFLKRASPTVERKDVASKGAARKPAAGSAKKPAPPPAPAKKPGSAKLKILVESWEEVHQDLVKAFSEGKSGKDLSQEAAAALRLMKARIGGKPADRIQFCIECYADISKRTDAFTRVPAGQTREEVVAELNLAARAVRRAVSGSR